MKSYFASIFGRSPIRPIQKHMEKVLECAQELIPLFEAVCREDFQTVEKLQLRIDELEGEADELKKEIRMQLPNYFFMAMDRRDLLDQLRIQDKLANKAKDIAGLILGREMRFPEPLQEGLIDFLERSVECSAQTLKAVESLDELLEAGFRGKEVEAVLMLLDEVGKIEKETDRMQVKLRRTLRGLENELPPVDTIFLYKIIEWTGDLADLAERVGNRLHLLLAK